ncbi:hypothetical protein CF386_11940 [Paraphotobacterium marinum]|uniref:Uncharacterized protein n=1 Tax=Paraphotobacterium marinum TaxID=1755811 RepID=A0A220VHM5_9GAMM|nr:hypothetical protein [Paraphotobacterium marinum]ASK79746.1 hypothetical protein CF386_11940 [Paraphotobacterium marinum]
MKQNLILGAGFIGSAIIQQDPSWLGTSRTNKKYLILDPNKSLDHINGGTLIITFPINNVEKRKFKDFCNWVQNFEKVILLSSTGAFLNKENQKLVDEHSPIDMESERYQLETKLMESQNFTILHLAGLYNKIRNPLNWLEKNRISESKNAVRLIHRQDVARIINLSFNNLKSGERYILSDGVRHYWYNIQELGLTQNRFSKNYHKKDFNKLNQLTYNFSIQKIKQLLPKEFNFLSLEKGITIE